MPRPQTPDIYAIDRQTVDRLRRSYADRRGRIQVWHLAEEKWILRQPSDAMEMIALGQAALDDPSGRTKRSEAPAEVGTATAGSAYQPRPIGEDPEVTNPRRTLAPSTATVPTDGSSPPSGVVDARDRTTPKVTADELAEEERRLEGDDES